MQEYRYLIVGGGMTSAAAVNGIRTADDEGEIGILSAEDQLPYDRPPLTKGLWTGEADLSEIWRDLPAGVTFHPATTIVKLDPAKKVVMDEEGEQYGYEKLLLATGGSPRTLAFGEEKVIYYRGFEDYARLQELTESHDDFAVIGGGFIGSEIAAALAMQDKQVNMIFPQKAIGAHMYPEGLAKDLNQLYTKHGVHVMSEDRVIDLAGYGTDLTVMTETGEQFPVNAVVAGIGIEPNVELAESAGIEVDDGIVVDQSLRTSEQDIYAAGDVANFEDQKMGLRRRVEHENAANTMGQAAGKSMAGEPITYEHSPMFYSDLFDRGYEAVGTLNADLEMVEDWQTEFDKGVVYYLDEGRVRGVLLWNTWGKVEQATDMLADTTQYEPKDLIGKL